MRTQQQILDRIAAIKSVDLFGFQTQDLAAFLEYKNAGPFLLPGITEEQWGEYRTALSTPEALIKSYMDFAWNKANECRGLSSARSVEHLKAWLWLDGKDELLARVENNYAYYGKPCLYLVCQYYGIDWKVLDDGRWSNEEDDDGLTAKDAIELQFSPEEAEKAFPQ